MVNGRDAWLNRANRRGRSGSAGAGDAEASDDHAAWFAETNLGVDADRRLLVVVGTPLDGHVATPRDSFVEGISGGGENVLATDLGIECELGIEVGRKTVRSPGQ
ncbi:MAG: hypothetical protein Q8P61_01945 [Candidatus Nanopelagicales bacterium]|nr:hypothetical protein [Candidatus Nanopelagicales bacterium]